MNTIVKAHQSTNPKSGAKFNVKQHSRSTKDSKSSSLQDDYVDPFAAEFEESPTEPETSASGCPPPPRNTVTAPAGAMGGGGGGDGGKSTPTKPEIIAPAEDYAEDAEVAEVAIQSVSSVPDVQKALGPHPGYTSADNHHVMPRNRKSALTGALDFIENVAKDFVKEPIKQGMTQ